MTAATSRARPVAVTATLVLLAFLVVPGSVYLANLGEFVVPPWPIARVLLIPALLLVVLAIAALRLAGPRDFTRYCALVAALTVLGWLQAYVLVWNYGLLDGSPIDWNKPWWRGWVDLPIWLLGLGAAFAFARRVEKPMVTAAFVLVGLQAASLVASGIANRAALSRKAETYAAVNRLDAMARFHPGRNALHLVLDSFQADIFRELVTGSDAASVQAALPGFTFYEQNLATFPATNLALPALLSGQIYRNHMPFPEFQDSVFGGKTLLNAARDAGFEVDIAGGAWLMDLLLKGRQDNAFLTDPASPLQAGGRLLDLGLFRLAPHWLKRGIHNNENWLVQRLTAPSVLARFAYFNDNAFLGTVARRLAADREKPVYKYFHMMSTHAPFVVDGSCAPAGVLARVRETVVDQSRCTLGFVLVLLERMKQLGLYDRTLIVLMGDHGGHIPPADYVPGAVADGDLEYQVPASLVGLATPLLAIKPAGATQPFRISPVLTSNTDVPATIDALLGLDAGMPGTSILAPGYGASGERRFYGYQWLKSGEYFPLVREHILRGSAYRVESWHVGQVYLPPEGYR